MWGGGKEAGTSTFSFAFPIQLLCDLAFVFPPPVYLDDKLCSVVLAGRNDEPDTMFSEG